MNYLVCEISGKQYLVTPDKPFEVDFLGDDVKEVEASVLLMVDDKGLKVGTPHLEKKVKLASLGTVQKDKIRVAKFHAKANYRRVTGIRPKATRLVWSVKS